MEGQNAKMGMDFPGAVLRFLWSDVAVSFGNEHFDGAIF
jgi:hypothetical protein